MTKFLKLPELHVSDIHHLKLFENEEVPEDSESVWKWSRSTLYRFMKRHGFVHEDQITHYKCTKSRSDIVSMRDNYFEWIAKYRDSGYISFIRMKHGYLKI